MKLNNKKNLIGGMTNYHDYVYSKKIRSLNNVELSKYSLEVEKFLRRNLKPIEDTGWYGNFTSANHNMYNFLTFPNVEVNKLYKEIVKYASYLLEDRFYMIKSWVNVYRKGEKVDWHNHWPAPKKVWHGFYCVQVGDSYTEYKIPGVKNVIKIKSKEGLLVIGKSEDDKHRSSPWKESDRPRITVAFDIVPVESVYDKLQPNHFIPV
jgi:hypothetical protein